MTAAIVLPVSTQGELDCSLRPSGMLDWFTKRGSVVMLPPPSVAPDPVLSFIAPFVVPKVPLTQLFEYERDASIPVNPLLTLPPFIFLIITVI